MAEFSEAEWEIIVAATHAGMSTEAFIEIVTQWLPISARTKSRPIYHLIVWPSDSRMRHRFLLKESSVL
ncbi:MAG: hypothetical protein WA740_02645 [Candidatus Binataceae bacterium]